MLAEKSDEIHVAVEKYRYLRGMIKFNLKT